MKKIIQWLLGLYKKPNEPIKPCGVKTTMPNEKLNFNDWAKHNNVSNRYENLTSKQTNK